jgi:hypothetical protein
MSAPANESNQMKSNEKKKPTTKPTTFEMNLPDVHGIKAVTLIYKIDKSVPTSPVVSWPSLLKSDWPEWVKDVFNPVISTDSDLTGALVKRFLDVFGALPKRVRKAIQRVWDETPLGQVVDVSTGKHLTGPLLLFVVDYAARRAELGKKVLAATAGCDFEFDAEIVLKAPPEVSGVVIAHELAHAYQLAIYGSSFKGRKDVELEANLLAEKWGYPLLDDRLWEKAKGAANPHLRFYAELFARFGYPPKKTVNIEAIERIYVDGGMPELIDLLHKPSEFNFSANSVLDEATTTPGVRERILQQRGNTCERCGMKGEYRQLYLHQQSWIEKFPQLSGDERSYFVLCSVCLREFAWTRFVFGVSQRKKVDNLYTTIGGGAGERLLSLFKEKLGDVTKQPPRQA